MLANIFGPIKKRDYEIDYCKGSHEDCRVSSTNRSQTDNGKSSALVGTLIDRVFVNCNFSQNDAIPILGTFLRKNHRALKLSTLTLLDTLVNNYSSSLNTALLNTVMVELPPLISDTDFHIAQLTLVLLTSIAKIQPMSLSSSNVLPEIISLAKSPLLQGRYLDYTKSICIFPWFDL